MYVVSLERVVKPSRPFKRYFIGMIYPFIRIETVETGWLNSRYSFFRVYPASVWSSSVTRVIGVIARCDRIYIPDSRDRVAQLSLLSPSLRPHHLGPRVFLECQGLLSDNSREDHLTDVPRTRCSRFSVFLLAPVVEARS